jgi:hypothetical protein
MSGAFVGWDTGLLPSIPPLKRILQRDLKPPTDWRDEMEFTINRLRTLKKGEEANFYRGPAFDIISRSPKEYYDMMMRLKEEMNYLVLGGRITIERSPHRKYNEKEGKINEFPAERSYTATGV